MVQQFVIKVILFKYKLKNVWQYNNTIKLGYLGVVLGQFARKY